MIQPVEQGHSERQNTTGNCQYLVTVATIYHHRVALNGLPPLAIVTMIGWVNEGTGLSKSEKKARRSRETAEKWLNKGMSLCDSGLGIWLELDWVYASRQSQLKTGNVAQKKDVYVR